MTLSISARCPESGQLGIAISSSSMAVGSRCPWLLPGVGAVASQNITLPSLGPHILGALEAGASVEQALNLALAEGTSANIARSRRLMPTVKWRRSAENILSGSVAPWREITAWRRATCWPVTR